MNKPTESEIKILQILWDKGPLSVREVNTILSESSDKEIGYTTTLKIIQIMSAKGFLKREIIDKVHIYSAVAEKNQVQEGLLDRFIDTIFNGSSTDLIMRALANKKSSGEELDEIRKYLDKLDNKN